MKIGAGESTRALRRVASLGPGGAGKSALATEIALRTGLPVVHLDPIFWDEGWTHAPAERVRPAFEAAIAGDRWILDGNFLWDERIPGDARFERADTVVFLDLRRSTCLWRVLRRLARDRGRPRPDLPEGANEGFALSPPFVAGRNEVCRGARGRSVLGYVQIQRSRSMYCRAATEPCEDLEDAARTSRGRAVPGLAH